MKILIASVVAAAIISCGYIFAPTQSQSAVKDIGLTEATLERLRKELGLKEIAFVIAVDFDGNVGQGFNPNKKYQTTKTLYPTNAKQIRNVYTATFVAFESSKCIDVIDSNGYKHRICMP